MAPRRLVCLISLLRAVNGNTNTTLPMGYVCAIGSPPAGLSNTELLYNELDAFLAVYRRQRHAFSSHNEGGNGMFHSFILWSLLRVIRPVLVVESGVWNGETSWLVRQASAEWRPTFVRIDPKRRGWSDDERNSSKIFDFRGDDFQDFASVDWDTVHRHRGDALVFFDDHMDQLRRLTEARQLGFGHVVFDDNYVAGVGDIFSLKNACDGGGRVRKAFTSSGKGPRRCDSFHRKCRGMNDADARAAWEMLQESCEVYWEGPPLAPLTHPYSDIRGFIYGGIYEGPRGSAEWTAKHDKIIKESTPTPIFPNMSVAAGRIHGVNLQFEQGRYMHMAYAKLKLPRASQGGQTLNKF